MSCGLSTTSSWFIPRASGIPLTKDNLVSHVLNPGFVTTSTILFLLSSSLLHPKDALQVLVQEPLTDTHGNTGAPQLTSEQPCWCRELHSLHGRAAESTATHKLIQRNPHPRLPHTTTREGLDLAPWHESSRAQSSRTESRPTSLHRLPPRRPAQLGILPLRHRHHVAGIQQQVFED